MVITYKERVSPFIGLFDKTPEGINCPHFWKFAVATGCPFKCSYCLGGGTKILMFDYSWKDISKVNPGEKVIGVKKVFKKLRLVEGKIIAKKKRRARCIELITDKTSVICSKDHLFLIPRKVGEWKMADELNLLNRLVFQPMTLFKNHKKRREVKDRTILVEKKVAGIGEVYDIQTTTENFVANGLISHNCYIQQTFKGYTDPIIYTNMDKMIGELRFFLLTHQNCVLNTGELADSTLLINHKNKLLQRIAPLFNDDPNNNKLLLLTKSANINGLLELKNPKNVIISFSVNTADFIAKFEKGTSKVKDRLKSAKIAKERGFEMRLRMDPMVPMKGWKEAYSDLVKSIIKINPDRITLGTLRFFNGVKGYAKKDGRNTDIFKYGTERTTIDGRMRVRHREYIYRFIIRELLKGGYSLDKIGLCKETLDVFKFLKQEGMNLNKKICNCTI